MLTEKKVTASTTIKVKKETDDVSDKSRRIVYNFDENGFPIWEERPIP